MEVAARRVNLPSEPLTHEVHNASLQHVQIAAKSVAVLQFVLDVQFVWDVRLAIFCNNILQ